jgi:predicted N-acetyltransferase YhbS
MEIKKYDEKVHDKYFIIKLITKSFQENQEKYNIEEDLSNEEITTQVFEENSQTCYLAIYNEKIIGVNFYVDEGCFYGTGPLSVVSEYQKKGVGKLLMENNLKIAKENKKNSVLCVNTHNLDAFCLYLKLGFKVKYTLALLKGRMNKKIFDCQRMKEKDIDECIELSKKTGLTTSKNLLQNSLKYSFICKIDDKIVGYTTGFKITSHSVVLNDDILFSLISYFCELNDDFDPLIFVSMIDYPETLKKCIDLGMKICKNMYWMYMDEFESSTLIYLPSI